VPSLVANPHDVPSAEALFFPHRILAQQLDGFGKLRALRLAAKSDVAGERSVVVLTPPLVPLGVVDDVVVREERLHGMRASVEVARELILALGHGSKGSRRVLATVEAGLTRALHFYVGGLVDACTVLVEPVVYAVQGVERVAGLPFVDPHGPSHLGKLQRLKRALPRVLRHVEDAYDDALAKGRTPSGDQHVRSCCRVVPGFEYEEPAVEGERAILDSERMRAWMARYVEVFLAVGRRLPPSSLAPAYVAVGARVTSVPDVDMLQEWADFLAYSDALVHDAFDPDVLADTFHPYFFIAGDTLCCVQMTQRKSALPGTENAGRSVALGCAYNWAVNRVNTGFYSIPQQLPRATVAERGELALGDGPPLEVTTFDVEGVSQQLSVIRIEQLPEGASGDARTPKRELWGALLRFGKL
jgi:hypothetical protein